MPLFKKTVWTLILISLFLFGLYFIFFSYAQKEYNYHFFNNFNEIIKVDYKEALLFLFYCFADSVVCLMSFSFNTLKDPFFIYFTFVLIVGAPSVFFFFKFLTYRGLYAIKLEYKRAVANPFYYKDWKVANRFSTYDNLKEPLPAGLQFIVITTRILLMVFMVYLLPFFMLIFILLEILGIIKGITRTGRINNFD